MICEAELSWFALILTWSKCVGVVAHSHHFKCFGWYSYLLKVVMSCHDLIDRDRFSRQTLKKQTNKQTKLSWERNLVNLLLIFLLWEKFDKAAYSLYALLCKASIFIVLLFLSQENMKGSTETWIEVISKGI